MTIDLMFDRDGTLILDSGYLSSQNAVQEIVGVSNYLRRFSGQGCRLHVVSNQSGVSRGLITLKEFYEVNETFIELYRTRNVIFNSVNYCLHSESDLCTCRKPKIGMLIQLQKVFHIDPRKSIFVGDKNTDLETARAFGCIGIQVESNLFDLEKWKIIEQAISDMMET
jgi:D-glycero-D-manno-heptose 1,7-bisphosphate phosphatase